MLSELACAVLSVVVAEHKLTMTKDKRLSTGELPIKLVVAQ